MSEFQEVMHEGARTLKQKARRWFLYALVFLVVIGGISIWAASWTYREGSHTGYLLKVTEKGSLLKTYEGQLNTSGFTTTEHPESDIWAFSVLDDSLYLQLQELSGRKVELHYQQRYQSMPWQARTNYIVTSVQSRE